MFRRLRGSTTIRDLFVALSMLALAFKLLFPPGFMPGTSLSRPMMLCGGQAPSMPMDGLMPAMAHDGHHIPAGMPDGATDHACPFAGSGGLPLLPGIDALSVAAAATPADLQPVRRITAAPGRGLAAPPPPSHAPPTSRT